MIRGFFNFASVFVATFSLSISAHAQTETKLDLLEYARNHISAPAKPSEAGVTKYNRLKQFGAWAHQDPETHCRNTRATVLKRDADPNSEISFKSGNCVVDSALWHDPYTGRDYRRASDIDIDHVVPLKNAYYLGAHAWRPAIRCHYANYLANTIHLRSVNDRENQSKGDRGPEAYLPPNEAFRCEYIGDWLKIKAVWELNVTQAEFDAVENTIRENSCEESSTQVSANWLKEQKNLASKPIQDCQNFEDSAENYFRSKGIAIENLD